MITTITLKKDFVLGQPDYHFELNKNFVDVDRILEDIRSTLDSIVVDVARIKDSGLLQDAGCSENPSDDVNVALSTAGSTHNILQARLRTTQATELAGVSGADGTNTFVTIDSAGTNFVPLIKTENLGTSVDLTTGTSDTAIVVTQIDPGLYFLFPFWSYEIEFSNDFGDGASEDTLTIAPLSMSFNGPDYEIRATVGRVGTTFQLEIPVSCFLIGIRR